MRSRVALSAGVCMVAFTLAAAALFAERGEAFAAGGGPLLVDSDGSRPAFHLADMRPGARHVACTVVTNSGSGAGRVRVLAKAFGRLAPHLRVSVEPGNLPPATEFPRCDGFVRDRAVDSPFGRGVIYRGTVAGLASRARGVNGGTWRPGAARTFRLVVTLRDDAVAAGGRGRVTLVWRMAME